MGDCRGFKVGVRCPGKERVGRGVGLGRKLGTGQETGAHGAEAGGGAKAEESLVSLVRGTSVSQRSLHKRAAESTPSPRVLRIAGRPPLLPSWLRTQGAGGAARLWWHPCAPRLWESATNKSSRAARGNGGVFASHGPHHTSGRDMFNSTALLRNVAAFARQGLSLNKLDSGTGGHLRPQRTLCCCLAQRAAYSHVEHFAESAAAAWKVSPGHHLWAGTCGSVGPGIA